MEKWEKGLVHTVHACCPPRPPLSRSTALPCSRPPSSVHMMHEFLSMHVSANECKLTFLSVTDTYVRTYVHCENRFLIQMRSAITEEKALYTLFMHAQWQPAYHFIILKQQLEVSSEKKTVAMPSDRRNTILDGRHHSAD